MKIQLTATETLVNNKSVVQQSGKNAYKKERDDLALMIKHELGLSNE